MQLPDYSRRAFLSGKSRAIYSMALFPPWSLPKEMFVAACTRCGECINACPERILYKGEGGFPEIDFNLGACSFCKECLTSCQADALHAVNNDIDSAWDLVVVVNPDCLSIQGITCRSCADHCEKKAIRFQLQLSGIAAPIISQQECTGCGACVLPCPVDALIIKYSATNQKA